MAQMWNNPGKWEVNPINFQEEIWQELSPPSRVCILDSTVRKITGTPGADYDPERVAELMAIADEMGVEWVEVNLVHGGMPSSPKLRKMFELIAQRKKNFTLVGTAWLDTDTIDHALDHGADAVNISAGRPGAKDKLPELYDYVHGKGKKVAATMGARVHNLSVQEVVDRLNVPANLGAIYCGIHENTGATSPDAWRWMMKKVRPHLKNDMPVVPHIHNTYGQATAAAIGAVTGGARGIDVTIGGIAINCGLASMEEVVTSLEILYGIDTGIKMELLKPYYDSLRELFPGFEVALNKPIIGDNTYICELEPFVENVLLARERGEERVHGLAPSVVGHENVVVWGENTVHGPATEVKLRQLGLPYDKSSVSTVLEALKRALDGKKEFPIYLTDLEMDELCWRVLAPDKTYPSGDQSQGEQV